MRSHPLRFGVSVGGVPSRQGWQDVARRAEAAGFDTLLTADHLSEGCFPPLVAIPTAAEATSCLRFATYVVNNDLHHPVLLAREAATLGALTDGRFTLGLGAGHMKSEYDEAGIPFDPGRIRVDRLEESLPIIKRLLAGEEVTAVGDHYQVRGHTVWPVPTPEQRVPLLVGGNGRRVLALAARSADAVGFAGFRHSADATRVHLSDFSSAALDAQVGWVREEAGDRFADLELTALVQLVRVTADRRGAAEHVAATLPDIEAHGVLDSPYVLLGTVEEIAAQLRERAERFGVTTWVTFADRPATDQKVEDLAPVIERVR